MALEVIDLVPNFAYFRDACVALARNLRDVLMLSGEPVTVEKMLDLVLNVPAKPWAPADEEYGEEGMLFALLNRAHERGADGKRLGELALYFFEYFPKRSNEAQNMLMHSVIGVLHGLGDCLPKLVPPSSDVPVVVERKE